MKTKSRSRFAAVFLALAMLLSFVPVEMFVSMRANADTTAAAAEDPKYVLESKNLTAFAANSKADGDSEKPAQVIILLCTTAPNQRLTAVVRILMMDIPAVKE